MQNSPAAEKAKVTGHLKSWWSIHESKSPKFQFIPQEHLGCKANAPIKVKITGS